MHITADDVRTLLGSELPDPALVLYEGGVLVLSEEALRSPHYAGALVVADRAGVRARLASDAPTQRQLEEIAAGLQVAVTNQGG